MEDYAVRRKEYVQRVRASFDELEEREGRSDAKEAIFFEHEAEETAGGFAEGVKLRFFCAVLLFCAFLFCKYHSYEIFTKNAAEVIDMIHENQYYTILQKYVKL